MEYCYTKEKSTLNYDNQHNDNKTGYEYIINFVDLIFVVYSIKESINMRKAKVTLREQNKEVVVPITGVEVDRNLSKCL